MSNFIEIEKGSFVNLDRTFKILTTYLGNDKFKMYFTGDGIAIDSKIINSTQELDAIILKIKGSKNE